MTVQPWLVGPRVLVVDDDDDLRRSIATTLRGRGCHVDEAATLGAGLRALADCPPQVVVVDGLLPDGTGEQLLAALPGGGRRPRVVYISAQLYDAAKVRLLHEQLGTDVVLPKPVDVVELALHVVGFLAEGLAGASTALAAPVTGRALASPGHAAAEQTGPDPLAVIREAYRARLGERLDELRDRVQAALATGEVGALEQARRQAHRLHGSAGTHGYPELGALAGEIEEALGPAGDPPPATDEALRPLLAALATHRQALLAPPSLARFRLETAHRPADDGTRVLLVHADRDAARRLAEASRAAGWQVTWAPDEATALQSALRTSPSKVVIGEDPGPGSDAFRLVRRLRSLPAGEAMRVALILAADETLGHMMAARVPVELLHPGPLTPALLQDVLTALERRRPRPARVLLVDDDRASARTLTAILELLGAEVIAADDPAACLDLLDRTQPDLVLLDLIMPTISGVELTRLIRASSRWCELPVVLTSTWDAPEVRGVAYRAGADDFLPKPAAAVDLAARVVRRAQRARRNTEARERDGLTGLLLRGPFISRARQLLASSRRRAIPVSLALIDLDHFKSVNDEHGHLAGDEVLAAFGRLVEQTVRAEDVCARWGGEEFVLALPGALVEDAARVLQRLQVMFNTVTFHGEHDESFQVSFSAGLTSTADHGGDLLGLLSVADTALYDAKRQGRRRIVSSPPPPRPPCTVDRPPLDPSP